MGTVWIAEWLFTIGFLHLNCWKRVLEAVLLVCTSPCWHTDPQKHHMSKALRLGWSQSD